MAAVLAGLIVGFGVPRRMRRLRLARAPRAERQLAIGSVTHSNQADGGVPGTGGTRGNQDAVIESESEPRRRPPRGPVLWH